MTDGGLDRPVPSPPDPDGDYQLPRQSEAVTTLDSTDESSFRPDDLRRSKGMAREIIGLFVTAFLVSMLIKILIIQAYYIPSQSMEPTLEIQDRVMVSKLSYTFAGPNPGEVIVFDLPSSTEPPPQTFWENLVEEATEVIGIGVNVPTELIKRVIAVGGDRVEIRGNRVLVNGVALSEPYIETGARMSDLGPIYIPYGHVWVLGDNRNNSRDSRVFGPIAEDTIVGRAFTRFWPPSRTGWL
ncbi:MAG: signal peptidase I [bacterium]|nr:signal peptidase I [bacterium]MCY3653047.1 signal peptidase I [bacterium]MYD04217.1 signal peptidase I [Acidimicrobiia bacterium]MYH56408.1 signal peptidase I [Acidimicrobiia bacterium]